MMDGASKDLFVVVEMHIRVFFRLPPKQEYIYSVASFACVTIVIKSRDMDDLPFSPEYFELL